MRATGAYILGCEGPVVTASERAFFADAQPFGFILFDRNLEAPDQIRALCTDLRTAVGHDVPIFVDQEGGRVQRLRPPLARDWAPPLEDVARFGAQAETAMRLRAQIIALELRALGMDGNCVPTLDIAREDTHRVLRNRCYGSDPETVVRIGRAVAEGTLAGGVLPVIKHMPGHGRATLDSHLALPRVSAAAETLRTTDFAAFKPFADLPLGMTAHVVFEAFETRPATLSPDMIRLIRDEIGFAGLLMTDDISMHALHGPVAESGAAALAAGCDLVLHCNGDMAEMQAIAARCGTLQDASESRAASALAARRPMPQTEVTRLVAAFEALNGQA